MSGPIVRCYGFPNFEKIFGERKLEHGVDEPKKGDEAKPDAPTGTQPAADLPEAMRRPETVDPSRS
jgi:hypothetical protein